MASDPEKLIAEFTAQIKKATHKSFKEKTVEAVQIAIGIAVMSLSVLVLFASIAGIVWLLEWAF